MTRLQLLKSKEYYIELLENKKINKLSNEDIANIIVDRIKEIVELIEN